MLNSKTIKEAAIARLTKEKADFESFKGTEMFSKLLGIYEAPEKGSSKGKKEVVTVEVEKPETETNSEFTFNANISRYGLCFAEGIYKEVFETLCSFCKQNEYFARSILKTNKSFTNCLAYAIHDIVKDKSEDNMSYAVASDYKIYQRAVEFYFDGSEVKFNMVIINPIGYTPIEIEEDDLKSENTAYTEAIETAKQEIIAKEKAEAERKARAEKAKAEREAKEKAKKEKAKKKKAKEEAKKAQGTILPDVSVEAESEHKPEPKKPKDISPTPINKKPKTEKAENPFRLNSEDNQNNADNIIQLQLF
jgi:hypothetical protein